jgi:hypothetical protein
MQSERTNERMNEHDPLMGVYTEHKTESRGGGQGGVNGNNRQFSFFSLFLSFSCVFFIMFTNSYTCTLSLLGQTTIEIDDDHQLSGHLIVIHKRSTHH